MYKNFREFKDPEIMTVSLDYVILQILKIGIKDPMSFPFPTQPSAQSLKSAIRNLLEMELIEHREGEYSLNEVGEVLSHIPINP